jgi:hypothetical protein
MLFQRQKINLESLLCIFISLFDVETFQPQTHLVRLDHFHTFRILFSLHDNALITRYFRVGAATANRLSSLDADLLGFLWTSNHIK